MTTQFEYTTEGIASRLALNALAVAKYLYPNGKQVGNEWQIGDVNGSPGNSLKISTSGSKAGQWLDGANQDEDKGRNLISLWMKAHGLVGKGGFAIAIEETIQWLGLPRKTQPLAKPSNKKECQKLPISAGYLANMRNRLKKNQPAMDYLQGEKRGLKPETINFFGLGLSDPYKNREGVNVENYLTAPLRRQDGVFIGSVSRITIPGVTQNGNKKGYGDFSPLAYYATKKENQPFLFICEGPKDVWRHWQALTEAGIIDQFLLITSTHGSGIPEVWKSKEYWAEWQKVFIGTDNDEAGNKYAIRLVGYMGREAYRVSVPLNLGKDWTEFWQNGASIDEFNALLKEAPVASGTALPSNGMEVYDPLNPREGNYHLETIDINFAFANNHLYYTTERYVVAQDPTTGGLIRGAETVVIRSDRTIHRAFYPAAPPGMRPVMQLTDGTLISKEPRPSSYATWTYDSISDFLLEKSKIRPLKVILDDVEDALRQSVWLPFDEDYSTLALIAVVTYVQSVCDAVPLILLNGPTGTGKTQIGNVLAKLSMNGCVIGQVSAATAARLIDETRGFVALDDVESIAAKANAKDTQASELVQALKVSYSKETAVKWWTDVKTMKPKRLDFFGVKSLSNTLGADPVLASRMIRIQTRKMPDDVKTHITEFSDDDLKSLRCLRNELHTWAFENVGAFNAAYREIKENKSVRLNEISAPMRAIAQICDNPYLSAQLEKCIERQVRQQQVNDDDPEKYLDEAVAELIKRGYETVSVTHIRLEMARGFDENYGKSSTTEIPEWARPEWLGRQLRTRELIDPTYTARKWVFEKNLRLVRFSEKAIKEVAKDSNNRVYVDGKQDPAAFCKGCQGCPYENVGCDIRPGRMKKEKSNHPVAVVN